MRALTTVSHCFHAPLLPFACFSMVLAYTHTYVHTCRHLYTFRVAWPGHSLFSTHRVTCFVVPYQQTNHHVYLYSVVLVTWFALCFEQQPDFVSTLFFCFHLLHIEKLNHRSSITSHPHSPHPSIHPCCYGRPELALSQLSMAELRSCGLCLLFSKDETATLT